MCSYHSAVNTNCKSNSHLQTFIQTTPFVIQLLYNVRINVTQRSCSCIHSRSTQLRNRRLSHTLQSQLQAIGYTTSTQIHNFSSTQCHILDHKTLLQFAPAPVTYNIPDTHKRHVGKSNFIQKICGRK